MKSFNFIIVIIVCFSCNNKRNHTQQAVIQFIDTMIIESVIPDIGSKKEFEYQYGEANNQIGFRLNGDHIPETVNCICINGDFAYVSDIPQGKIKKINLVSGKIEQAVPIPFSRYLNIKNTNYQWIDDENYNTVERICFFNNHFYLITFWGEIIILDTNLNFVTRIIPSEKFFGYKNIFYQSEDTLLFYRAPPETLFKDTNNRYFRCFVLTNQNFELSTDTVNGGVDFYEKIEPRLILGKKISSPPYEGLNFYYKDTKYEADDKVPEIRDFYCQNFDFSDQYMVYLSFADKEMTLTVWDLLSK